MNEEEIYDKLLSKIKLAILEEMHIFLKNNKRAIPGIYDSIEVEFYRNGAMEMFRRIDKMIDDLYIQSIGSETADNAGTQK